MKQHVEMSNFVGIKGHLFFVETTCGTIWNYKLEMDEVKYSTTVWWIKNRINKEPRQCVVSCNRNSDFLSAQKEHNSQIDLLYYMVENEESFANETITL